MRKASRQTGSPSRPLNPFPPLTERGDGTSMDDKLENEIRSRLRAALTGVTTMREFHRWLVPATWGITEEQNRDAARLTFQVSHLFNRKSSGELTANEFRFALAELAG